VSLFVAKRDAMKSYHVKMHSLGINWVAAEIAGYSDGRVCNRLLDQGFGPLLSPVLGFMRSVFTFRPFAILR